MLPANFMVMLTYNHTQETLKNIFLVYMNETTAAQYYDCIL